MTRIEAEAGADARGELTLVVAKAILHAHDFSKNDGNAGGWESLTPDWQETLLAMGEAAVEAYEDWHSTAHAPIDEAHDERIQAREREIYDAGYDAAVEKMWRERE